MNGLTLRISSAGGRKSKNCYVFAPVDITKFIAESLVSVSTNSHVETFTQSSNADEQLSILKNIINEIAINQSCDYNDNTQALIKFLAVVFFYTEAKHPVKCFITRQIIKNLALQQPFSDSLADEISNVISDQPSSYKDYINVVSKLILCIENFPAGSGAVKSVELTLAEYLDCCLRCCVDVLKKTDTLAPTEKNEIFNLSHSALRLLLYIVQKLSSDKLKHLNSIFNSIRQSIQELLFDEDVPMDTKSVCGILFLNMLMSENGPDSWIDMLQPNNKGDTIRSLLSNEASQLALYSAIVTVVAMDSLQHQVVDGRPAISVVNDKILAIGERCTSDSVFILGVTRTVVQISKGLDKVADSLLGQALVDNLLEFVWSHLEHYMDSVRHLTAQVLSNIVKYCSKLDRKGNPKALINLFAALTSIDRTRKSYYVSVTSLIVDLGASKVLQRLPSLIPDVIAALSVQAVQASATVTLETLLQKHIQECKTSVIYDQWIELILSYVTVNTLDSAVLNILENLLARAVKMDENIMDYILPHIKQSTTDLKCVLMLLSVARKSGVSKLVTDDSEEWKGIIGYDVLEAAAVDAVEETRILSLSLIVESPKTTEVFSRGELKFVLRFLKYNINAQSPNFRQLVLSMMKKFTKRLEDSYKVLRRQKESSEDYYVQFLEELRSQCFDSLIPGANYSRRVVALQVLVWCELMGLEGYDRVWKENYVDKLLLHLEDSYENNKAFALEILNKCPAELLTNKKYSISLEIEDILRQASSLKPTDCISAAYKLDLLRTKLPEKILEGKSCMVPEPVTYTLLHRLQARLSEQLSTCERSIVDAAVHAPMYGLLHCMVHLITRLDCREISGDEHWSELISAMIRASIRVTAAVAGVVNNSSPEGHLPMDMGGVEVTDHGNSGGVRLEDGRQVTAQMVLLCAWRSVKEVSLLLGEISSHLSISGEGSPHGTLTADQMMLIGEHFTSLLAETKHRGAFEQAYVGFTKLLARLWRCRTSTLHELPRRWLDDLMEAIAAGDKKGMLCATRRSAGLPFMIQALVTTELQVHGNPKCFQRCMTSLLHLASTSPSVSVRSHCINILRALLRNSALDDCVATNVGDSALCALKGFEGDTWMERNSSTLLFSALMVRVFGVQRSRDADRLCVRNRMTGRIFFLRYPQLYDFMLDKLKEVSSSDENQVLRPALYPILLLLARLYPSSLEGTVSNLKLVAFIPHVLACAKSAVLKTRQLAAKAMVALISPEQYISHIEAMFALLCDEKMKKNYGHGILLQLIRLLDARPDSLTIDEKASESVSNYIKSTYWILEQATGNMPCYLLADEYVKVFNILLWRFPSLINEDMTNTIQNYLETLLFYDKDVPSITSGRDICLTNALYLYLIILNKYNKLENICEVVLKGLLHKSYEVTITILNFLLILHENFEAENRMEEHLTIISNKDSIKILRENAQYVPTLCHVLKNVNYLECTQKTLKVLTLEQDTERYIVETKFEDITEITDERIIKTLFECISTEHENLTHIYLESLSNFVKKKLKESKITSNLMLEVIRVIFACSSSDTGDSTRCVVVSFLENNVEKLFKLNLQGLSKEEKFEFKATLYATIVTVLEDDVDTLRQRTSNVITKLKYIPNFTAIPDKSINTSNPIITKATFTNSPPILKVTSTSELTSSKAAEVLREVIMNDTDSVALLVILALLDFKSEVCMNDEVNDECRVFDQNERYNIYLEETIWTSECIDKLVQICHNTHTNVLNSIQNVIKDGTYKSTIEKLCNNNVSLFVNISKDVSSCMNNAANPKVKLFVDKIM